MRKDPTENKGRVPAKRRVPVLVLQPFENHATGEKLEIVEGEKLSELVAQKKVRIDESYDAGA